MIVGNIETPRTLTLISLLDLAIIQYDRAMGHAPGACLVSFADADRVAYVYPRMTILETGKLPLGAFLVGDSVDLEQFA